MNMLGQNEFQKPLIIAALHLPPFPGSHHPEQKGISEIVDYALRNTESAVQAGIQALYLQDLGDHPWSRSVQPRTIAMMSVVGSHIRQAFPDLMLGICLMSHGARESISIAQAIRAQFVRLKVYVGAMVKAEGILEGCAYEAINYRAESGAEEIAILADVYDRTGRPLGEMPLTEAARAAAVFGRADGLILTGGNFTESLNMLEEVKKADLGVPLFIGGGAKSENILQALTYCDGAIVSTAFKPIGGWKRSSLAVDWDVERIKVFMQEVRSARNE